MKEKICEWTFEGDDKKIHVIKLDNTNRKGIIYLDNVLFGKLPRQGLSNFEYKFEVAGKKCSFVYLVADLLNFKAPRFAMDGKYVNYDTLVYIPVPKITIYGIFSKIISLIFIFASVITAFLKFDKIDLIYICVECFLGVNVYTLANLPMRRFCAFQEHFVRALFLIILLGIQLFILFVIGYVF